MDSTGMEQKKPENYLRDISEDRQGRVTQEKWNLMMLMDWTELHVEAEMMQRTLCKYFVLLTFTVSPELLSPGEVNISSCI